MPFELHPEFPDGGGVETKRRFSAIAPLAEAESIPFNPPERFRPSRRAHQAALLVEHTDDDAAAVQRFHDKLYAAYWDVELDVEDPAVLIELAADTAVDPALLEEAVLTGALLPALGASMVRANEWGATGTPSYLVANALLVPGLQDDEFFDRVVERLSRRLADPES
jgi:predicted DsbA family dithiol-disulfide isomerase